jgi:hypothetical protein
MMLQVWRFPGAWMLVLGVFPIRGTNYPVTHDLFRSGPWTGFYNYSPQVKHRMDLDLTFAAGKMTGGGNDDVGRFVIKGQYDAQSLECWWTKTYVGAHDVFYRGFREGKGIWGAWEITVHNHGGFHIWPKRLGEGETQAEAIEQKQPVEATVAEPAALPKARSVFHGQFSATSPTCGRCSGI